MCQQNCIFLIDFWAGYLGFELLVMDTGVADTRGIKLAAELSKPQSITPFLLPINPRLLRAHEYSASVVVGKRSPSWEDLWVCAGGIHLRRKVSAPTFHSSYF